MHRSYHSCELTRETYVPPHHHMVFPQYPHNSKTLRSPKKTSVHEENQKAKYSPLKSSNKISNNSYNRNVNNRLIIDYSEPNSTKSPVQNI